MYQDLKLSDRARVIKMAVESGIRDLDTIEQVYNTFAQGGDLGGGDSREEAPVERRKVGDHYLTLEQYKELQRDTIRQAAVQKALTRNKGVAPIINGEPASSCIYTFTDNYGRKYQVAGTQTFAANPEKYGFEVAGPVKEGMEGNMYLQLDEFGVPYHATMITGYTDKGEPLVTYSSGHAGGYPGGPIPRDGWNSPDETYEHYLERYNRTHSPEADYHKNTKAWRSPQYETYRFIGTPDDNIRWQTEWEAGSQPSFVPIVPEVLNNRVQFAKGGRLFETGGPEGELKPSFGGEIRQGRKFNAWDRYLANHPMTGHRLRKAKTLIEDAARVHPYTSLLMDFYDIRHGFNNDWDKYSTSGGIAGKVPDMIYNVVNQAGEINPSIKDVFLKKTLFGKVLSIPDMINDSYQFIEDFSTPVTEFKDGGHLFDGGGDEDDAIYLGELEPSVIKPEPVSLRLVTDGITKDTPITHSSLYGPGIVVSKGMDDPTYDLFLANCSDATGEILSSIAGQDLTKGITTPYGLARKVSKIFKDYPRYREFFDGLDAQQSFLVPWYDYRVARDIATQRRLDYLDAKYKERGIPDETREHVLSNVLKATPMLGYRLDENGNVQKFDDGGSKGESGFNAGATLLKRLKRKYLSDYADKGYVYSYPSNPFELFGYAISPYARTSEYGNYMLDVMPKNITDARRALFAKNFGVNSDGKGYENAIVESKYRPAVSSNPDAKYYTLPIDDPKARFEDLQSVIGTAKYDFGEDENGKYISIYDKWDLAPFSDKGNDFPGTTPPEIYDRFYQSEIPEIYSAYSLPGADPSVGYSSGMDFSSGGRIHIKPENRGKFTALKKRTGHSASWFKAHGTPAQKKMAVFALNAKKWKHGNGGHLMTKL